MKDIFKQSGCIGILGGTFNPVHIGHIMLADKTIEQYPDIEKIVIMPNNLPAYKNAHELVDSKHRIRMLELATEDRDYVSISDLEIKRGGATYTIDTLREIKNINPSLKIYFIIGADSLFQFEKWREHKEILRLCTLLAARRDSDYDKMSECARQIISDTGYGEIGFIQAPSVDAASSEIRKTIAGGSIPYDILPEGVAEYIAVNKLYRQD